MFRLPGFMMDNFTYVRNVAGSYVNGIWTEGTAEYPQTGKGAVQPLNPGEVQMLQEGQRHKASLKIYTTTALQEVNEASKIKGDIVTVRGKNWEVQKVSMQSTPFTHYKCILIEAD